MIKVLMTSEQLKNFLRKHKLSNDQFAELLGITKPAVDHWLTGRRSVPMTTVKLLKYFDAHPDAMEEF